MKRLLCCAVLVGVVASCSGDKADPAAVIGTTPPDPSPSVGTTAIPEPGPPEVGAPGLAPGLARPTGSGPGPALAFRGAVDVPDHLLFFLVIGSDARPGQPVAATRADSIHVAAVDPRSRRGTVLGLSRDSYVNVPGYGRRKINAALPLGGPDLLVRTVRELTGFPIRAYALTGFAGMVDMVDSLGGLDVYVHERMNDRWSGARFEEGWHHMDGRQVLAYTRNRHVPGGDLTRSKNQGQVILHTLDKLRAETSDEAGVRRWLDVLYRHASLDMGFSDALRFGKLARTLATANLENVVAPGRTANRGGQSVVVLDDEAYRLFRDVGADALADGNTTPVTPAPSPTPAPTPTPSQTPTPAPQSTPTPTATLRLP